MICPLHRFGSRIAGHDSESRSVLGVSAVGTAKDAIGS